MQKYFTVTEGLPGGGQKEGCEHLAARFGHIPKCGEREKKKKSNVAKWTPYLRANYFGFGKLLGLFTVARIIRSIFARQSRLIYYRRTRVSKQRSLERKFHSNIQSKEGTKKYPKFSSRFTFPGEKRSSRFQQTWGKQTTDKKRFPFVVYSKMLQHYLIWKIKVHLLPVTIQLLHFWGYENLLHNTVKRFSDANFITKINTFHLQRRKVRRGGIL